MPSNHMLSWEQAVQSFREKSGSAELVRAAFFDDPLIEAARRYHQSSEWRAVRALLPERVGTALDLGAGRGIATFALASDGWSVTALEPDPSDLVGAGAIESLMHEAGLQASIVRDWGEALPFADDTFDLVHARQVLHHAQNLDQLCLQLGRVLKPGGVFLATREHVLSHQGDLPEFLNAHPLHNLYGGENAYILAAYKKAIRSAGIKLNKVLGPYSSDINLYPATMADTKRRWGDKFHLPSPSLVPDQALDLAGRLSNTPGRLYTFVGEKPRAA